jgi:hypothetical protein
MRQLYGWLTASLGSAGVAGFVVGVVLLTHSRTPDVAGEVGKGLLTLAVALLVTGALSMVVRQIDERRSQRDAWQSVLHDLVAASQTVLLGQFRLSAHRSAATYQEVLTELMEVRVELRRLCAMNLVTADPALRAEIDGMRRYLDALSAEYRSGYLAVARQQRLDEAWLDAKMKALGVDDGQPDLPASLRQSGRAWQLLQDRATFPRLAALLDDHAFRIDAFRRNYKRAKTRLERHAGFRERSQHALERSASKLVERSLVFIQEHPDDIPDAVKADVTTRTNQLRSLRGGSRTALEDAMAGLAEAAVASVSAVYPRPARSSATA